MSKKVLSLIIILVATVILGGIGLWYYFATKEKVTPIKIAEEEEEEVAVGYGQSIVPEVFDAVAEAVSEVKMGLKGRTPDFVVLFFKYKKCVFSRNWKLKYLCFYLSLFKYTPALFYLQRTPMYEIAGSNLF